MGAPIYSSVRVMIDGDEVQGVKSIEYPWPVNLQKTDIHPMCGPIRIRFNCSRNKFEVLSATLGNLKRWHKGHLRRVVCRSKIRTK